MVVETLCRTPGVGEIDFEVPRRRDKAEVAMWALTKAGDAISVSRELLESEGLSRRLPD